LTKDWMPSLLLFLSITGLVVSSKDLFKILKVIAFAAGLISFLSLSAGASQEYGRLRGATGSLANANALALYILIGIPCALLLLKLNPRKIFLQLAVLPLLGMFLVILLRTASRSAMLNLLVMAAILFWTASIPSKARMGIAGALLVVAALSFTPDSAIARLRLLLPGAEEEQAASALDPEAIEEIKTAAEGSSEARRFVFTKALGHTIRNPVFGVGPGAFMAADAQQAELEGRATLWRGTHNTFVQISSETGIPGFAMFMAMLFYTLRALLRIRTQTRLVPKLAHLFHGALSLILILTSITLSGIFGHFAYGPFFPLIIAFGQVFERSAQHEIAAFRSIRGHVVPSPRPLPRRPARALPGRPV
jgi:O-antigen ligase